MTSQPTFPLAENFNTTSGGKQIQLHYLRNQHLQVALTNYGARVVALLVKDKNEHWKDVVVGFNSIDGYLNAKEVYHGAIIGRYANRIAGGRFILNGKTFQLPVNNGANHLHGGPNGFHNQVWEMQYASEQEVQFQYVSTDGEEGYPGRLTVSVTYKLQNGALYISYEAATNADTVLNLTNHSYFNLDGQGAGSIDNHLLTIHAHYITPVETNLIPAGEMLPVADTPFDFRKPRRIGDGINSSHPQIINGNGYDHNFVLDPNKSTGPAAIAYSLNSGIEMNVFTQQPGVQLYTGNFMQGEHTIKYGMRDNHRSAFCLETQHFPDSPNHAVFPSTVLKQGQTFRSQTSYAFAVKRP